MSDEMDTAQEGTQETSENQHENQGSTDAQQAVEDAVNAPSGWNYAEGVEGQGEVPEWFKGDKYKTVADQAKAYKDLESRFGGFTGAPDKYEINLSDELKEQGVEISTDDTIMDEVMKWAKDLNMSQEGFDSLIDVYAMTKMAEAQAFAGKKEEQMALLGENADRRIDNLVAWGNKNLSPELYEGFEEAASSAAAIEAIEHLISMTRQAPMNPNEATPASMPDRTEWEKKRFEEKDSHGNLRYKTDPNFRKQVDQERNQLFGTEPHKRMVGR